MRKYLLPISLAAAILIAAFVLLYDSGKRRNEDFLLEGYLLAVNGRPVSREEFDFFLDKQRSLTASRFGMLHNAQIDRGFWERDFDGETPLGHAKGLALNVLLTFHAELTLGAERGLLSEDMANFNTFAGAYRVANEERAQMLYTGEVFFGLTEFDKQTFFHNQRVRLQSDLLWSQIGLNASTEEELRNFFARTMHLYGGEVDLVVEIFFPDGRSQELEIFHDNIPREHIELRTIYDVMVNMEEGEIYWGLTWENELVAVYLIEKIPLGFRSFNEVRYAVAAHHAEILLQDLIIEMVEGSVVEFNKHKWEAVTVERWEQ